MRNQKGYSMMELLCVIVLLALIIVLIAPTFLEQIDRARRDTLLAEARMVYVASQAVVTETASSEITKKDLERGLTGTITNVSFPKQMEISQKMNALLKPDLTLAKEATQDSAKITITVEENAVKKVVYQKMIGKYHYTAVIEDGNSVVRKDE